MGLAWIKSRYFWKSPVFYLIFGAEPPSKYHHPPGAVTTLAILFFSFLPVSLIRWLSDVLWRVVNRKTPSAEVTRGG